MIGYLLILLMTIVYADEPSGNTLFYNNCTLCHGEKGFGDGPASSFYSPRPRNLVKDPFVMGDSVEAIANTVKHGFNQMPAFYKLSNDERTAVAKYVKSLRNK